MSKPPHWSQPLPQSLVIPGLIRASIRPAPRYSLTHLLPPWPRGIFGNARLRQAYEFGERRIWPARATRQRGHKGGHGRAVVPVEPPQVDIAGGAASGAARPQEPIAGSDGRTDRRREQHRHPRGLASVPRLNRLRTELLGDLWPERAACSRLLGRCGGLARFPSGAC